MENFDILPCPFCGSVDLNVKQGLSDYVRCEQCHAEGPVASYKEDAVTLWNGRKPVTDLRHFI